MPYFKECTNANQQQSDEQRPSIASVVPKPAMLSYHSHERHYNYPTHHG